VTTSQPIEILEFTSHRGGVAPCALGVPSYEVRLTTGLTRRTSYTRPRSDRFPNAERPCEAATTPATSVSTVAHRTRGMVLDHRPTDSQLGALSQRPPASSRRTARPAGVRLWYTQAASANEGLLPRWMRTDPSAGSPRLRRCTPPTWARLASTESCPAPRHRRPAGKWRKRTKLDVADDGADGAPSWLRRWRRLSS